MTKEYLIKILKIRNVTILRRKESINDAIERTGGYELTETEKVLMHLVKI